MHRARSVEPGSGATSAADRLVILVIDVAESEVVHRTLRCGQGVDCDPVDIAEPHFIEDDAMAARLWQVSEEMVAGIARAGA